MPGGTPSGFPDVQSSCSAPDCQMLSIDEVLQQAVYSPTPDIAKLAAARTPRTPNPLEILVGFCITTAGKTTEIRVVGDDPDPAVTKVVLDTIAKWRFKPFIVDGAAIKTCSGKNYAIQFE
jgi:protein TonB